MTGCDRARRCRRAREATPAVLLAAVLMLASGAGCSSEPAAAPSAREVLSDSVREMLSWESYRYTGTSTLTVAGDRRLDSEADFTTDLRQNDEGALDGHMVVKSPDYSYETYTIDGIEYTRVEGGEWERKVLPGPGAGMVSAESRRIIARFPELVDDVRFVAGTPETYTVSCEMGERYRKGAASIADGGEVPVVPAVPGPAVQPGGSNVTVMKVIVDRKTLRINGIWMKGSTPATGDTPAVETVTEGAFSRIDDPVDIDPPPGIR